MKTIVFTFLALGLAFGTAAQVKPTFAQSLHRCDSLMRVNERLLKRGDSLEKALFISVYKIQRVKYYLAIVNRKPSQGKFLRSWITRAVK